NVNNTVTTNFTVRDSIAPVINDYNATPQTNYYNENITIFANVTDNVMVSSVLVEILGINYSMQNISDQIYRFTFNTNITVPGTYNYTIYANDTSVPDNWAISQTGNFTIIKAISDIHLFLDGFEGDYSINEDVLLNITSVLNIPPLPSEFIQLYINGTLSGNGSSPVTNTTTFQPGYYNVTAVYVGNENYTGSNVTYFMQINDTTNPNVTVLLPINGTIINELDNITLELNVTDNVAVDTVLANVSWHNGLEFEIVILSNIGDIYNFTFSNTSFIGLYNITFIANDTTGNINNTQMAYFIVRDSTPPVINNYNASPNSTEYENNITIFANVTDNVNVSGVWVEIEGLNHTMTNVGDIYSYEFNTTDYNAGNYTYFIYANDTSVPDNWAINVTGNFEIQRATSIMHLYLNGTEDNYTVNEDTDFNITAILQKPSFPQNVQIYKNGSLIANSSSPVTNISQHQPGLYNITAIYLGNINYRSVMISYFLDVLDITNPDVIAVLPILNDTINETLNVTIQANVTDNVAVDKVFANISWNGTWEWLELEHQGGEIYNGTFNRTTWIGPYHVQFFANDTSGNINDTAWTNFTIKKRNAYNLTVQDIIFDPANIIEGQNVTINLRVNNSGELDAKNFTVQLNISFFNGTVTQVQTLNYTHLNLSAFSEMDVNFTWIAKLGTYIFDAYADAEDNVTEENELDNNRTENYTVSIWHTLYGDYDYDFVLTASPKGDVMVWNGTIPMGVAYYSDADANYSLDDLEPLEANTFIYADMALGVQGFLDSISKTYDVNNNGIADQMKTIVVDGRTVNNVPYVLSTNSTNFITAVMYDSADGVGFNGTQDLVFVTEINAEAAGAYGTYDFEIKIPTVLQNVTGGTNAVRRIDDVY
ncbi:hypothetical protein JXA48_01920, partial [Candidatus Woesearchaeota archaeon]|nr:hypothetical protein [Candidatus Woesearchaeota archaeon]